MARTARVEDLALFEKDMASDASHRAVTRDSDEGYGIGVTSTPAFLINGLPALGAQPTDVFTDIIDEAAVQAQQKADGDESPRCAGRLPRRPAGPPEPLLGPAAAGLLRLLLHQPHAAPGPHGPVLRRALPHPGAAGSGRLLRRAALPRTPGHPDHGRRLAGHRARRGPGAGPGIRLAPPAAGGRPTP